MVLRRAYDAFIMLYWCRGYPHDSYFIWLRYYHESKLFTNENVSEHILILEIAVGNINVSH